MTRLRTIIAENIKAYRKEKGISQLKLANLIDSAPNYIAMIEAEKRFPTDTMLEKIAVALNKEPYELFMIIPIQKDWQKMILTEMSDFIALKLNNPQCKNNKSL
jgi:transcriptional regulator with XRE-family HTH domain